MIKVYFMWLDGMRFIHNGKQGGFDIYRQTPDNKGIWKDIQVVNKIKDADYIISIDTAFYEKRYGKTVNDVIFVARECEKTRFSLWEKQNKIPEENLFLFGKDSISPTLWLIGKSYNDLKTSDFPNKTRKFSIISSDLNKRPGHQKRRFVIDNMIKDNFDVDLYGKIKHNNRIWKRFNRYYGTITDKWDAIAPYRYTLAMENHSQNDYFTEKIVDAYLAGCMPIYYGCPNISDYFPENSYYYLNLNQNPKLILKDINNIINSNYREKNINALKEAKRLCLEEYQFWPVIKKVIDKKILCQKKHI